jgi:hypothetical protein
MLHPSIKRTEAEIDEQLKLGKAWVESTKEKIFGGENAEHFHQFEGFIEKARTGVSYDKLYDHASDFDEEDEELAFRLREYADWLNGSKYVPTPYEEE